MSLSRRGLVRILSFSLALICTLTAALLLSNHRAAVLQRALTANYRRAYFGLLSSLESIEASLAKASVSSSPESLALLSSDIWNSAETAGSCLGGLPFVFSEDSRTAAFLNRVGSFSYSLASLAGSGNELDAGQRQTLSSLRRSTAQVLRSLSSISAYIYEEDFFTDAVPHEADPVEAYDLFSGMTLLESAFPETPTLLYDGPYSEHLTALRPAINDQPAVSRDRARSYAASVFHSEEDSVQYEGEVGGDIPCYLFSLRSERHLSLLVTQQGGRLLGLTSSGDVRGGDPLISTDEALRLAGEFLNAAGYASLVPCYHHTVDGVCYINFEASEDDVLLYPDLIQIGVSLSGGEILSFDARGYLSNHRPRTLTAPTLSREEAAKSLSPALNIRNSRLALIPTAGKNELLCYEFSCSSSDGDRYLVYINCASGKEERIAILREDKDGTLTF